MLDIMLAVTHPLDVLNIVLTAAKPQNSSSSNSKTAMQE
jgi:hypothetical protein